MNDPRPRLLVLRSDLTGRPELISTLADHFEVSVVESMTDAMAALRHDDMQAILSDAGDFLPLERELVGDKAMMVLNTIGEGVCVIDADGRCAWSNDRMRQFKPNVFDRVKQHCQQARSIFAKQIEPADEPQSPKSKKFTFGLDDRYFEVMISPIGAEDGRIDQVVAVVWDATSGQRLQRKIDAIDAAGRELARLERDAIVQLSPNERLQLLRDKIIRFARNLMNFDHFAIRLLEESTNRLEVVIAEGLPADALDIDLYAQAEGNGISGYVAATGRSYICHDVEKDPRYVIGLTHSKSSLTVPLRLFDKVVGIFNVESERVGAFNEDDRQFAEIFCRYVAVALHMLNLMVAAGSNIAGRIADNVGQEISKPLNDIVTEAQTLIEQYVGHDDMRQRLNHIVDDVLNIRRKLRDAKAGPNVVLGAGDDENADLDPILAGKRVLIADDEQNIRTTIRDILKPRGAHVELCKDGGEACHLLEEQGFDLVISDIRMPYRNGYEIFAAAKRRDDNTPVLLMTGFGYDPNHSIVRASGEGLAGVLFKPFKVDQLIEEVHAALQPASGDGAPKQV